MGMSMGQSFSILREIAGYFVDEMLACALATIRSLFCLVICCFLRAWLEFDLAIMLCGSKARRKKTDGRPPTFLWVLGRGGERRERRKPVFSRQPVVDTFDVSFHLSLPTSALAQRRSSEAPCQGWQSTSVCLATVSQHPCSQPTAALNCIFPILHTAPHSLPRGVVCMNRRSHPARRRPTCAIVGSVESSYIMRLAIACVSARRWTCERLSAYFRAAALDCGGRSRAPVSVQVWRRAGLRERRQ